MNRSPAPWFSVEAYGFWVGGDSQVWVEDAPGNQFTIRPDNGLAGRIGVGVPLANGLSVAAFARFGGTGTNRANLTFPTAGYNRLFNVLGGNFSTFYTAGRVTHKERHAIVDFEVRKDIGLGTDFDATVKAGVRYANFRADTNTTLVFLPLPSVFTLTENRRATFSGIGPRIGFDLKTPIDDEWRLDLSGSGSFLWGPRKRNIVTVGGLPGVSNTISVTNDALISNLEGSAALTYVMNMAELSAGIRGEAWWGILDQRTTFAFLGNFGNGSADRFFWGPFLRATVKLAPPKPP